jgi:hypothetical protein
LQLPLFCVAAEARALVLNVAGAVRLEALSERALNYLFARALLGGKYGRPAAPDFLQRD